jgi:hypothetical protein
VGVGEEEADAFDLGACASSWQMDVASGPAVVVLAEAVGMGGASTLGDSLYLLPTPGLVEKSTQNSAEFRYYSDSRPFELWNFIKNSFS